MHIPIIKVTCFYCYSFHYNWGFLVRFCWLDFLLTEFFWNAILFYSFSFILNQHYLVAYSMVEKTPLQRSDLKDFRSCSPRPLSSRVGWWWGGGYLLLGMSWALLRLKKWPCNYQRTPYGFRMSILNH